MFVTRIINPNITVEYVLSLLEHDIQPALFRQLHPENTDVQLFTQWYLIAGSLFETMAQYLSSFRLESGGVEVTTVYHQPVLVHCCVVCRPNIDI